MKKTQSLILLLGLYSIAYTQTPVDHPLKLNIPIESQEFMILSTTNQEDFLSPIQTTLGHYDKTAGLLPEDRIKQDHSVQQAYRTIGTKTLGIQTLDYNGDRYDEVVAVIATASGFAFIFPVVTKTPLTTSQEIIAEFVETGVPYISESTIICMDKGDFDGDGTDELVSAYRNYNTAEIVIEIRKPGSGTEWTLLGTGRVAYLGDRFKETFDITVDDFDGDGIPDLALCSVEDVNFDTSLALRTYKVNVGSNVPGGWTIDIMGYKTVAPPEAVNDLNLAISSGLYDLSAAPQRQISIGLIYKPLTPYLTQCLYIASTHSGIDGLKTIDLGPLSYYDPNYNLALNSAISIVSGDLNNVGGEEIALAFDAQLKVFTVGAGNVVSAIRTPFADEDDVPEDFYKLANNNYLSIGDADMDGLNDLLMVTTNNDYDEVGTIFDPIINPDPKKWIEVRMFGFDRSRAEIRLKAHDDRLLESPFFVDNILFPAENEDENFNYTVAAAFGEFSGGRAILREPSHSTKRLVTPLIVNNAPPHHFDIIDGIEMDLTDCYPDISGNCSGRSVYKSLTTNQTSLETTLNSDWGVSGTLSAGGSLLGIGLKVSATAKYGEGFSESSANSRTISVSTISTADRDDQIYAEVADYDIYEYPVDSSNVIIGHMLALMRKDDQAAVLWAASKSDVVSGYIPDHEVGNLLSYPPQSNMVDYNGVLDYIKQTTAGYNVSTGGSLELNAGFADFQQVEATATKTFGSEVSASASYGVVSAEVTGSYNSSEIETHTTAATEEIDYTSTLSMTLTGPFSNANYTVTPSIYYARSGAVTLGYSVDPTVPGQGLQNFWSDYYMDKADLTLIMPWKYDPEKGYNLGSTPDKRRLSRSMVLNKPNFRTGDTVQITAFIQNYSFLSHQGAAEFQFYAGDPDNGGILLSDIDGQSTLSVNGPFTARDRTQIQFNCLVPANVTNASRIYVVIDPNNLIDEIHEDNNIGWIVPGGNISTGLEQQAAGYAPLGARLFPNPAVSDWTQVELELLSSGTLRIEILDLQGRIIDIAYRNYLDRGNYIIPIEVGNLQNGYYLLNVAFNEKHEVLRLVKLN